LDRHLRDLSDSFGISKRALILLAVENQYGDAAPGHWETVGATGYVARYLLRDGETVVLLNSEDLPIAERYRSWDVRGGQVARQCGARVVYLAREIAGVGNETPLRWANGNQMDCRRCNLQVVREVE
jgi:hypothetical protein